MTTTMKITKKKLKEYKKEYIDEMIYRITNNIIADNFYTRSYEKEYLTKIKYNFYKKDTTEFFNDYKNIILTDMKDYDIDSIKHFILSNESGYYYDLNGDEIDDYDKFEVYLNTLSDDNIHTYMNENIESAFVTLDMNTFENYLDDLGIYMSNEEINKYVPA
jgi:hypothetical protein